MKKYLISLSCSAFALLLFVGQSFGQEKEFGELPPVTITANSQSSVINAKVSKSFQQYFKDASKAKWYQAEKNFLVTFIQNDQVNKALFTKTGVLVYHIKFGAEKDLPTEVREVVKGKYFDQKINRIYNISQDDRDIWVVSLEDSNYFVMVRVEDMQLEETTRIIKAR